jgi:GNAT superfamily N-acetyltransferase
VHYLYHRSTTMQEPICYLQDLFTLPTLRGKSIGRSLIEAVYERARAAGATRVYWHQPNGDAPLRSSREPFGIRRLSQGSLSERRSSTFTAQPPNFRPQFGHGPSP